MYGHLNRPGKPETLLTIFCVGADRATESRAREAVLKHCNGWSIEVCLRLTEAQHRIRNAGRSVVLFGPAGINEQAINFIRHVRAARPDVQLISICKDGNSSPVLQFLAAGAVNCLIRPVDSRELCSAIANAERDQPALCPKAAAAALDHFHKVGSRASCLSARELQVLIEI